MLFILTFHSAVFNIKYRTSLYNIIQCGQRSIMFVQEHVSVCALVCTLVCALVCALVCVLVCVCVGVCERERVCAFMSVCAHVERNVFCVTLKPSRWSYLEG